MRDLPFIKSAWDNGGPFIGDLKPVTRVTIQEPWPDLAGTTKEYDFLRTTSSAGVGSSTDRGVPMRWWQKKSNAQGEKEIPNIATVSIDRSVDQDAASFQISLNNQWMYVNGTAPATEPGRSVLGQPGYFTFDYGETPESQARWGHEVNEWNNYFVPNAVIRCLDTETEMFTDRGWLCWHDVKVGDRTLGINPETGRSEWQDVKEVFKREYTGKMYRLKTRSHDSLTTANHRWLTRTDHGNWRWRTTETLAGRSAIPLAQPGGAASSASYSDDFVELAAWYFTEGAADHRLTSGGSISQSPSKNPGNCERIRVLMKRMFGEPGPMARGKYIPQETVDAVLSESYDLSDAAVARLHGVAAESVRRWRKGHRTHKSDHLWNERWGGGSASIDFCFRASIACELRKVVLGWDKVLSVEFLQALTQDQLELFIEVCVAGDGTIDRGSKSFIQDPIRMPGFEYACVLAGLPVHVTPMSGGRTTQQATLLKADTTKPIDAARQSGRPDMVDVDYDDIIWCPRVEHGNFVARRNGSIFYTGNTYTGFGGDYPTDIATAVADGNLALYGVFLIDDVTVGTNGKINISGRDMAKLLVDQQLFPPLVPNSKYPLSYYRWDLKNTPTRNAPKVVTTVVSTSVSPGIKPVTYYTSSVDKWYGCVDTETEALTNRGWMLLDDIEPSDLLLGMNPETGLSEWQPLQDLLRYQVENESLVHIKAQGFDMLVTENHRWITHKLLDRWRARKLGVEAEWRWTTTDKLMPSDCIPRVRPYGDAPVERFYTDAFVELVGWYWTEGTWNGEDGRIYQSRKVNPDNCDRIEAALTSELGEPGPMCKSGSRCKQDHPHHGWNWKDYGKGIHYNLTRRFVEKLVSVAPEKALSMEFLLRLTQDQLELLFEISMLGDRKTDSCLGQADEGRLKGFEMLCVLTGRKFSTNGPNAEGQWVTSIDNDRDSQMYHYKKYHRSVVDYTGTVWCPTVKYSNWVARRNGKVCITGNSNSFLYGHTGIHSVDGNVDTYALGEGNSGPDRPFAVNFWEYTVNAAMNGVFVHPWAGGYTMYVSVMEGGSWQGSSTVPYDPSNLYATQPHVVNTGANIPYVASFTVPWEQAREYSLPRDYNAQRVRITFRHLAYSGLGTWKYRSGIREFRALGLDASHDTSTSTSKLVSTWVQAAGGMYDSEKTYQFGYMTVSRHEQQDAFGDARHKAVNHKDVGPQITGLPPLPTCVRVTDGGGGYYVLDAAGSVDAYGDAVWYGSPYTTNGFRQDPDGQCWDMAITPSGEGYWVLNVEGNVYAYGDAVDYGSGAYPPDIVSIEGHPTNMGYWTLRDDGRVFNFGATTHYGNLPTSGSGALKYDDDPTASLFQGTGERARCLRATKTGNGYWILTSYGRVYAFGDAVKYGQPHQLSPHTTNFFSESYWELIPGPDDLGYLLVHADGSIHAFGDIPHFGSATPGGKHELRYDGNYLDYRDIWRDLLLWSGFLLYDPAHPSNQPAPVYAGLETTGAFSSDRLPDEIFDKKPVIDAITEIREVVGYIFRVDAYGRPIITSSNTWHFGNFNEDGFHVEELFEIDEAKQLTDYSVSTSDQDVRSKIIISSHDPYADLSGTVTNNYTPPSAPRLRGIVKPAMWVNAFLDDPTDQKIMAELIGLQISFQERLGQITCLANPAIEIDDQVRIYERQTGESNIHYVRGVSFNHDLDAGNYMTTLTTHWLGEGRDTGDVFGDIYPISAELQARVDSQQYGKYSRDPGSTI